MPPRFINEQRLVNALVLKVLVIKGKKFIFINKVMLSNNLQSPACILLDVRRHSQMGGKQVQW